MGPLESGLQTQNGETPKTPTQVRKTPHHTLEYLYKVMDDIHQKIEKLENDLIDARQKKEDLAIEIRKKEEQNYYLAGGEGDPTLFV